MASSIINSNFGCKVTIFFEKGKLFIKSIGFFIVCLSTNAKYNPPEKTDNLAKAKKIYLCKHNLQDYVKTP